MEYAVLDLTSSFLQKNELNSNQIHSLKISLRAMCLPSLLLHRTTGAVPEVEYLLLRGLLSRRIEEVNQNQQI